jgi:DNA-3-methyladenine glycosylase II
VRIIVKPPPPFDFNLSAQIFSHGDRRIQRYEDGAYWHVIRLTDRPALIKLHSSGTTNDPELNIEIEPLGAVSLKHEREVRAIVGRLFNFRLDLLSFYDAVKRDRIMAQIAEHLWGLKSPSTATIFEALIDSVIEQQISLKAAWSIQRKLVEALGDTLIWKGQTYFAYPKPEKLAIASIERLRACGLSNKKGEYIKGIGRLVMNGFDLEALSSQNEAGIIEKLCKIRGVGVWTAEMTMIRGMQKFDAIPADDLGLRRVIGHYYYHGEKITGEQARRTAQAWAGWRGLASFYLIVAKQTGIEVA